MMFHYIARCIQFILHRKKSVEIYLYFIVYVGLTYKLVLSKDSKNAKLKKQKEIDCIMTRARCPEVDTDFF